MHEQPGHDTLSDESRDEALDNAVRALPRELAPARDLWPALAARLPAHRQQRWRRQTSLWVAAAVLAAVWLSPLRLPLESGTARNPVSGAADTLHAQWQAAYETALTSAADIAGLAYLPLGQEWDTAIAQVNAALVEFPDDPYLLAQLERLHRERLQALRQAIQTAERYARYY
jgi:hypothetical protein